MMKKILILFFVFCFLLLASCRAPSDPIYPPTSFDEPDPITLPDDRFFLGEMISVVGELSEVSNGWEIYVYQSPVEVYDEGEKVYNMYSFPVDLSVEECERHDDDVMVIGVLYMGEYGVSLKECTVDVCNCHPEPSQSK